MMRGTWTPQAYMYISSELVPFGDHELWELSYYACELPTCKRPTSVLPVYAKVTDTIFYFIILYDDDLSQKNDILTSLAKIQ